MFFNKFVPEIIDQDSLEITVANFLICFEGLLEHYIINSIRYHSRVYVKVDKSY